MSNQRSWPNPSGRCIRCDREALVIVDSGRHNLGTIAACGTHMEWAFLFDAAGWAEAPTRPRRQQPRR